MVRLFKWLMMLGTLAGVLAGMSYVGARATAGKLLGIDSPLSNRTVEFAFVGVTGLRANPRAWVFTFRSSELPGVARAQIYISPTGKLLATQPADLELRLERLARSKMPPELRLD